MSWDHNLTDAQRRAASHVGGHARLLAGPGTGKTLALTRRIIYLIHEGGVDPSEILVLTFTRAATAEIKRRVAAEMGNDASRVSNSTLHSYALKTILRYGAGSRLPQPIRIADDWEERYIIEEDLKEILDLNKVKEARSLLNQLSADWERLATDEAGYRFPDPRFYGAWDEHRRIFGYALRAELVYQLKHALEEGAIRIDQPPKYILVDEYQDLNPCDLAVIKKITEYGAELYVAGDDDQSIYGFRYADPEGIRRFDQVYIPATSLSLEECQRCGSRILALANYVAQQDPRRAPKSLTTATGLPPGEVHILNFPNQNVEAEQIAQTCRWLMMIQNLKPEEILILIRSDRNGAFSIPIRFALERQRLPVGIVADPLEPLNSKDGRRFLSILRLVVNNQDHLAWRTLFQIEKNGIGKTFLREMYGQARLEGRGFAVFAVAVANDPGQFPKFGQRVAGEVTRIQQLVNKAQEIFQVKGFMDGISELVQEHILDPNLKQEISKLFKRVIDTTFPQDLEELLRVLNVSLGDAEQEQQMNAINIMTMHQAKGLTATAVFIIAAEDEHIPGRAQGMKIDDERRLLYVSLTRPRRYLYISHCHNRTGQQIHTGRNPGSPQRMLTRFLSGGPVLSENGVAYVASLYQSM